MHTRNAPLRLPAMAMLAALATLAPATARGGHRPLPPPPGLHADPLVPLVYRMDRYFQAHEGDGVTLDSRYWFNPSEAIRMSVVSQLLAYAELYRVHPTPRIRQDIIDRGHYLSERLDAVRSGSPFDGMLALSLLEAYAATGDSTSFANGQIVVEQLKTIETSECILNGGLMVAMAMAKQHVLTGDAEAGQKAYDIVSLLPPFQHTDGSFPHWCVCSRDIHYTGWMSMELILLERMVKDDRIEPILQRMRTFMEGRIDSSGHTHYESPCPPVLPCTTYYDSRRTGCDIDYDTRAWTVEPGYNVLLFDHFQSPEYGPVMDWLLELEYRGTFADKWDFIPPPDDPEYLWSIADTSVANMSIIFWSLTSALSGRGELSTADHELLERAEDVSEWEGGGHLATDPGARSTRPPLARPRPWSAAAPLFRASTASPSYCDVPPAPAAVVGGLDRPGSGRIDRGGADAARSAASPGPPSLRLGPIVPNPVLDACDVRFVLPATAEVSLAIYDAGGRRVRELAAGSFGAGEHAQRWDRRDASGRACRGGLYFARLRVGGDVRASRILVLR